MRREPLLPFAAEFDGDAPVAGAPPADEAPSDQDARQPDGPRSGWQPPEDVFDLGYREWFDRTLGREPRLDRPEPPSLGLHYTGYFESKLDEYGPNYKGPGGIFQGMQPGYLGNGFQSFRTIGPGTTYGYALGYYATKGAVLFAQARLPLPPLLDEALDRAGEVVAPGAGEAASFYGNLWDNRDVMSHNVQRAFQILNDPNSWRGPFNTWPPTP